MRALISALNEAGGFRRPGRAKRGGTVPVQRKDPTYKDGPELQARTIKEAERRAPGAIATQIEWMDDGSMGGVVYHVTLYVQPKDPDADEVFQRWEVAWEHGDKTPTVRLTRNQNVRHGG